MEPEVVESLTLPPDLWSPHRARDLIARHLTGPRVADAVLVVSEMVTNALMHSHGEVRVTVRRSDQVMTIEVWDGDPARVPALRDDRSRPGGRGVQVIEALSDSWGFRLEADGKTVWCAFDLDEAFGLPD